MFDLFGELALVVGEFGVFGDHGDLSCVLVVPECFNTGMCGDSG